MLAALALTTAAACSEKPDSAQLDPTEREPAQASNAASLTFVVLVRKRGAPPPQRPR
jgi:hypothetical protein